MKPVGSGVFQRLVRIDATCSTPCHPMLLQSSPTKLLLSHSNCHTAKSPVDTATEESMLFCRSHCYKGPLLFSSRISLLAMKSLTTLILPPQTVSL